ncbi:hypothetical protein HG66A1_07070 [Gimesia chilikensis]|uniref:Uncharacterized protein n=1 Tax=Gimesia chilikensis TaxID=2605989 RepID=A0A517PHT0_9PLAN|nr:hypothetical protein HG66A1_07070 [Gimesia chilikensis]
MCPPARENTPTTKPAILPDRLCPTEMKTGKLINEQDTLMMIPNVLIRLTEY